MSMYDHVLDILHYHLESVERQSIKALRANSSDYKKNHEEVTAILNLPWFADLLNDQLTEPVTPDQAKTIVRFMKLQSLLEYDLKIMFYLYGMKDASAIENILK